MNGGAALRRLSPAPYRLRILFRGAFLLLVFATVAMALFVLQQGQQLSYRNYQDGFRKNAAQIAARLRHPAGQLALLNPQLAPSIRTPVATPTVLHPLLLPFSALDFDDQGKVQEAIEMAGCMVQYAAYGQVCVAIGNNPYAGGFIYVAGSFSGGELVAHVRGDHDIGQAHRVRIAVDLRGEHYQWLAPFESNTPADASGRRGRLTGFTDIGPVIPVEDRPIKDFRGWLWQSSECIDGTVPAEVDGVLAPCSKRSFFSVRLPVAVLRDALFDKGRPVWPPADLDRIDVHVQVLPPGDGAPLFNSDAPNATPPFALGDLIPLLLPGETLRIRRHDARGDAEVVTLVGVDSGPRPRSRLLDRMLRAILFDPDAAPVETRETIATPLGSYALVLTGDVRSVDQAISAVATRVAWFVGAVLGAILLAWLAIEVGIIRRMSMITRRAARVSKAVNATHGLRDFDLGDLRGPDELGVLAGCVSDLVRRVQEDVHREHIRAEQEKDLWHAVGHEIMSPLQSLMALHGTDADGTSRRYIERMQQAVRVLYGNASPSEAFQSTLLQLEALDLNGFLRLVAENAESVGIDGVSFEGTSDAVLARVNEHALEDVVTHVLRNAQRYRREGTPIRIVLGVADSSAVVTIDNQGSVIPDGLIDRIFEYGVSDPQASADGGNRGQGLFVAKTYMAKMAGTIAAQNLADGVRFVLVIPRLSAEPVDLRPQGI